LSLWQLFCYTNALTLTVLVSIALNWSAHATPRPISCYLFLAQRKVTADWIFEGILCPATVYGADVVESLLELAIEIAREGREGTRVGTVFTLGDEDSVLARSRPLILDPLLGHPESARQRNMSAVTKATALWFQRSRWYESSVTVNWSAKSPPGCGSWNMLPTFAVL
jgi:hypothetical protein